MSKIANQAPTHETNHLDFEGSLRVSSKVFLRFGVEQVEPHDFSAPGTPAEVLDITDTHNGRMFYCAFAAARTVCGYERTVKTHQWFTADHLCATKKEAIGG